MLSSVHMHGVGLLSGADVGITLHRLPSNARPGIHWFPGCEPAQLHWSARRSTILAHASSGAVLHTPEHLSAASLGWPRFAIGLEAPGSDIPILDGSAQGWVKALTSLCGPSARNLQLYDAPLVFRQEWEGGYFECVPSGNDCLCVEYSLERHAFLGSAVIQASRFGDLQDVLSARTFILEPDYIAAVNAGLLPGAQEGCGVLLRGISGEGPELLSGGPLRHPREPAMHKILDLLGDLALLGPFLPKLRIRIHNGGHVAHQQILTRLKPYVPS